MLQSISPITGNNTINKSLNFPIDNNQFSEIKNYILDLEKNLKNQEFEINNLKNTILTQEQEKLKYKYDLEKKESIIQELQTRIRIITRLLRSMGTTPSPKSMASHRNSAAGIQRFQVRRSICIVFIWRIRIRGSILLSPQINL